MKLAAIEAMWETEPAPAAFTAFGFPDQRTARDPLRGAHSLGAGPDRHALARQGRCRASTSWSQRAEERIRDGIMAYDALRRSAQRQARCRGAAEARAASRRTATISATRCCSSAMSTIRARPRAEQIAQGRLGHRPERAAAVLVVPHHGRPRLSLHRCCSPRSSGSSTRRQLDAHPLAAQGRRVLRSAAALDRRRARLDRRRIRPPALGDRRRAADRPRRSRTSASGDGAAAPSSASSCSTRCWP